MQTQGLATVNTRTPKQEAAIEAAIAHLEFLMQARRAARANPPSTTTIRSAVLDAAMAIVEEPKGQGMNQGLAELATRRLAVLS